MKKILQKISEPIKSNLDEFDKHFDSSLESEVKTINTIVKYLVRKKVRGLDLDYHYYLQKYVEILI